MDKLDQILQVVAENQTENRKGFSEVGIRLSKMDDRLGGVEVRLGGMDKRFDGMDKRFDGIEKSIGNLDVRFKGLDARVSRLEDNVVGINTRLMTMEEKMVDMTHFDKSMNQTFNKIDGFMVIIDRYESEIAAIGAKYERLEDRVSSLESQAKA
jgi:predicted  nucleic acid-binding Zn-ribbon protein